MQDVISSLTAFYGLDWMVMVIGLAGTYMITQQKRMGFLLNAIACVLGVVVAGMSDQIGYVVYNAIILCMLSKAFYKWPKLQAVKRAT